MTQQQFFLMSLILLSVGGVYAMDADKSNCANKSDSFKFACQMPESEFEQLVLSATQEDVQRFRLEIESEEHMDWVCSQAVARGWADRVTDQDKGLICASLLARFEALVDRRDDD